VPLPTAASPAATSVERAYEFLRRVAVEFELKTGERLNEGEIARRLHMSRAPVREAMNRLVTQDLLVTVPNQGFSCRRLSASEVVALYEVRADLEAGAVERLAPAAVARAAAELEPMSAAMRRGARKAGLEDLVDQDESFHLRLAELGGNLERMGMLGVINARIRFVRRINLEDPRRMKRSLEEHAAIVESLRAGDPAEASRRLRRHLALSAEDAAAFVNQALTRIYATTTA